MLNVDKITPEDNIQYLAKLVGVQRSFSGTMSFHFICEFPYASVIIFLLNCLFSDQLKILVSIFILLNFFALF